MAKLPKLTRSIVGPPLRHGLVAFTSPIAFPPPLQVVEFTGSKKKSFIGKVYKVKPTIPPPIVQVFNKFPVPAVVVHFTPSRKRFPTRGRIKFVGVYGQPTAQPVSVNIPPPVQVVHFTGSLIRRGIPRKGTTLLFKRFGLKTKNTTPRPITIINQVGRKRRLPQTRIQIGKIPRHFSNIIQATRTLPIHVVRVLRKRITPGKVLFVKHLGKKTSGIIPAPITLFLQDRPKRQKTRGKIRWIHGGGIVTAPISQAQLPPIPIQVVQFTGNRWIRLRPHTRITFTDLYGMIRRKVRPQPIKILQQITRKRKLPFSKVQFTQKYGKQTKNPKAKLIRCVVQISRKHRNPTPKFVVGKAPRSFGVSNVGTSTEFRPTYRPRRR